MKTKGDGGEETSYSSERKNLEKLREGLKHDTTLMVNKCRSQCFSYTRRNFGR